METFSCLPYHSCSPIPKSASNSVGNAEETLEHGTQVPSLQTLLHSCLESGLRWLKVWGCTQSQYLSRGSLPFAYSALSTVCSGSFSEDPARSPATTKWTLDPEAGGFSPSGSFLLCCPHLFWRVTAEVGLTECLRCGSCDCGFSLFQTVFPSGSQQIIS